MNQVVETQTHLTPPQPTPIIPVQITPTIPIIDQIRIDEMSISGKETPTPTLLPSNDTIYVESDDINPQHIYYNKENNPIIVNEDEENSKNKRRKTFLRDVRNSKR